MQSHSDLLRLTVVPPSAVPLRITRLLCESIVCSLSMLTGLLVWMYPPIETHFGCFQFLAVTDRAIIAVIQRRSLFYFINE